MTRPERARLLHRAAALSLASVAWGGSMAVLASVIAAQTGSLALGGYALDSAIDAAASVVLVWRFRVEQRHPHRGERLEARAALVVGIALLLAATYVSIAAIHALAEGDRVRPSSAAVAIAVASLVVLPPLAVAKRRTGGALGSRALRHDAFLTAMAAVLAALTLAGMALSSAAHVTWADPSAALLIAVILAVDGVEAIRTG
jgi:divalent metal cation (Fe/Co/Zn/Cd) transporter